MATRDADPDLNAKMVENDVVTSKKPVKTRKKRNKKGQNPPEWRKAVIALIQDAPSSGGKTAEEPSSDAVTEKLLDIQRFYGPTPPKIQEEEGKEVNEEKEEYVVDTPEDIPEEVADLFKRFEVLALRQAKKAKEEEIDLTDIREGETPEEAEQRQRLERKLHQSATGGGSNNAGDDSFLEKPEKKTDSFQKISRRKLRQVIRPTVAQLKMACSRPDVVEAWDVTAPEAYMLVWLKAFRNSIRVPQHWRQKRKYLSGKKAVEKTPFKLPEYIEATKIGEIRAAILERESHKTLKQRQREKLRPKSNRMHVDFQTLHDAFFKYATLPEMTKFGDVYYEGKEREEKTRQFKPGQLSTKLKEALGLTLPTMPPPWLLPMQRYGPPPSYPNLKVPGLNSPPPPGSQWGFHAGGWGKPPSDQYGNPIYPAVFAEPAPPQAYEEEEEIPVYWGELVKKADSDDDSDLSDDGEEMEDVTATAAQPATGTTEPEVSRVGSAPIDVSESVFTPSVLFGTTSAIPGLSAAQASPTTAVYTPTPLTSLSAPLSPSAILDVATPADSFAPDTIREQLRVYEEADKRARDVSKGELPCVQLNTTRADSTKVAESETKKKKKSFKF